MRLTLRTLLAYLDDTMDPAEIKQFGQRVAESDTAQELIARIKQITRRRRLTAPPATGPGAFDPNLVAEYLDNELTGDQIAEVEKMCLESDVHLAEIAACHQILTLVLGQPALVPPTARERMYGLVHGREAIPFRKASTRPAAAEAGPDGEVDESGLLALPFFHKPNPWLRWGLPAAGLLLLVILGVVLLQAMSGTQNNPNAQHANLARDKDKDRDLPRDRDKDKDGEKEQPVKNNTSPPPPPPPVAPPPTPPVSPQVTARAPDPPSAPSSPPPVEPIAPAVPTATRPGKPSTERTDVGIYEPAPKTPSILVQRHKEGTKENWKRVAPQQAVFTGEPLASLPGFASDVRLNNGVRLLLRGNIPEFSRHLLMNALLDSTVVLHKSDEADLDFTLQRGRVYVSNGKPAEAGPAKVRVRINDEPWDLTLEPGAEVGIDLLRLFTRDSNWRAGEEPRTEVYLCMQRGKGSLRLKNTFYNNLQAPPGAAVFIWDNEGPPPAGPLQLASLPSIWSKELPVADWKREQAALRDQVAKGGADQTRQVADYLNDLGARIKRAEDMQVALDELSKLMVDKKPVPVVLVEGSQLSKPANDRLLCVYALGAIDEVGKLLDVLAGDSPALAPDRDAAIFTLRLWISRSADQVKQLYADDGTKKTGLLLAGGRYRSSEADIITTLLHDFNSNDSRKKETFELLVEYLNHDKLAIRELARWHLVRNAQGLPVNKLPRFNAADPPEVREQAVNAWRQLLADGSLPPRAPEAPAQPK